MPAVGKSGASPPTGHVCHLLLFLINYFLGNSGNNTLLHIHQCTSHGNMRLASKKNINSEGRQRIFGVESKNNKFLIISN